MLIYGSCVSRDTFEFLPEDWRLLTYVARQSAISVGSPVHGLQKQLNTLPSAFQNRMVGGDVRGDFLAVAERLAPEIEVLLMDLVDERGGVIEVGDGFVTKLAEIWSAGGRETLRGHRHVALGSEEHFDLWTPAIRRVADRLQELNLFDRTVVLRTPWADQLDDGGAVPVPDWMTPPVEANTIYARYFDVLSRLGFTIVELPEDLALSSRDHKWGPSPFHYTDDAYRYLATAIQTTRADR
ncbi:hypothetical protein N803_06345 [Knoellia subterranea KCTC 19937]|uniref:SGNH hydrolase-type esterase domain-containing protein n=1 Tax=Knoellia subterranea KCTC 19937 TaxID=1385521 RepID=A0A0A0JJ46_9MICO|nr:hypothetical protein N803_06345 [Knoellia subterranea KCTC 19937]